MAVSIAGFDIDLVTLPHQSNDDDSDNDDGGNETDEFQPKSKPNANTNWDWNAMYIPLNPSSTPSKSNFNQTPSLSLSPSSSTIDTKSQPVLPKSPLKHTTEIYRDNKSIPPWVSTDYSFNNNFLDRLHLELIDFTLYISPTKEEHLERLELINKIEKIIKDLWPNAKIYIFGSMKTKLYLPISDIDIVVYPNIDDDDDDIDNIDCKLLLAQTLKKLKLCSYLEIISSARVPLVKFTDNKSSISVDICFEKQSGIIAADEINLLQNKYPVLRPLTYFLKYFLFYRGLNEPFHGGMGSYLLQMLIINLIQTHPVRSTRHYKKVDSEISLGGWLLSFFKLYGKDFNYSELGISQSLNTDNKNNYFIKTYKNKMKLYDRPYLLCCECPFESTKSKLMDSGRNTYNIMKIKQSFNWAHNILLKSVTSKRKSILSLLVGLRGKMLNMRPKNNKKKYKLNEIMPLTQKEIEMDKLIKKTFNKGNDNDELFIALEASPGLSTSSSLDDESDYISSSSSPMSSSSDLTSTSSVSPSTGSESDNDNKNELIYYEPSEFQHSHLFLHKHKKKNKKLNFNFNHTQNIETNPYLNKKYDPYRNSTKKRIINDNNISNKPPLKKRKINKNDLNLSRSYSMPNLKKSLTPCIYYKKGSCNKGDLCSFQHGINNKINILVDSELDEFTNGSSSSGKHNVICWNFSKGYCWRGTKCRWLHQSQSSQTLQSTAETEVF